MSTQSITVERGQTITWLGDPKDLNVIPIEDDDTKFIIEYPDPPTKIVDLSSQLANPMPTDVAIPPPSVVPNVHSTNFVQVGDVESVPYTLTHNGGTGYSVWNGTDIDPGFSVNANSSGANSAYNPNGGGIQADPLKCTDNTGGTVNVPWTPTVPYIAPEYDWTWPWPNQQPYQPSYTYTIPQADLTYDDLVLGDKINVSFDDISSESYRVYHYPGGETIVIVKPIALAVTKGGHRLFDALGECHYIAQGWLQITWKVKPGEAHFVK